MPDSLVHEGRIVSPEAMAEHLKACMKKNRIRARSCAVILPASQVFVRQTELPMMTDAELQLNLPYEFRDFITDERDKYFYDYYVISTQNDAEGHPVKMTLMAAAVAKELVSQYNDLCRWAGLKLKTAVPAEMALVNLLRRNAQLGEKPVGEDDQCFIDLGHDGTRIFFFQGDRFDAVRAADIGGARADLALSETLGVDPHIAQARKEANADGELLSTEAAEIYRGISTEVMRAVNFYSYNNPNSELKRGWFCGGGSRVAPLCDDISQTLELSLSPIASVIPGSPDDRLSAVCFSAIGAAMQ